MPNGLRETIRGFLTPKPIKEVNKALQGAGTPQAPAAPAAPAATVKPPQAPVVTNSPSYTSLPGRPIKTVTTNTGDFSKKKF
jgi:hypothetical protein